MTAMKLASDNAQKVSQELVLNYNKVRQSVITKEIIEINATQSSLSS
jgi:F0F1-type ATP synthase gamma subunit